MKALIFPALCLMLACGQAEQSSEEMKVESVAANQKAEVKTDESEPVAEVNIEEQPEPEDMISETQEPVEEKMVESKPAEQEVEEVPLLRELTEAEKDALNEGVVGDPMSDPVQIMKIQKADHTVWNNILKQNVSGSGKVNYNGMKANLSKIDAYIKELESFSDRSEWTRNEKLAYWINIYNAVTVRLIAQNYPVKSITDLHGGKPWDQKLVNVGGKSYSLNNIENDIIRPKFKEARIHFAVNCAAKSCPKLLNAAFMPETLSSQLSRQTKQFINSNQNDIAAGQITISKIFEWYKTDFKNGDLIAFLNQYSTVTIQPDATVGFKEYDWDLNE